MKTVTKHIQTTLTVMVPFILLQLTHLSCTKFVDVDPPVTSSTNVFAADPTAAGVLTGIYGQLSQRGVTSGNAVNPSFFLGLSADELTLFSGSANTTYLGYYRNNLSASAFSSTDFWKNYYPILFNVNLAIKGLSESETLTPAVKNHLLGEAKFLRAFCYFYLVNLYGDVPLILTTDYISNSIPERTSKEQVYVQIIEDLTSAELLMSSNYLNEDILTTTSERIRPTIWAATALLARSYLYKGDWTNAELKASSIINNSSLFSLATLNSVFLKNSTEAIWQLKPVNNGWNTEDARTFILTGAPNSARPVFLSSFLLNSFEVNDQRKINGNWVKTITSGSTTYYSPYKYKVATLNAAVTEYLMVFRLSEQYLIRSEARAKLGNIAGSQADLDIIRGRAGLPNTTANSQSTLLSAILQERRVEFFSEWGHRWLDLKRTNTVDAVMTSVKPIKSNGLQWESYQQLFPVPISELQRNPFLTQNQGY